MKAFITSIYAIICIAFIGISHYYWTEKTTVSQASGQINENKAETRTEQDVTRLLTLANNWPEQSVERFKQALDKEKPFKIVIAGSPALGGENGWAQATKASLLDSFGSKNISVEIKEYDMTSSEFIKENKHLELASLKGDLILLEPFILQNNGNVSIGNTMSDLTATIEAVRQTMPDTAILLQPSYPVYQARIYPNQVNRLKEYAEENGIIYLDHWQAWPDPNSDEIKNYLAEDQSGPNEKGHQLWSAYIAGYLINK